MNAATPTQAVRQAEQMALSNLDSVIAELSDLRHPFGGIVLSARHLYGAKQEYQCLGAPHRAHPKGAR